MSDMDWKSIFLLVRSFFTSLLFGLSLVLSLLLSDLDIASLNIYLPSNHPKT